MKHVGVFRSSRMSSLVRGFLPISGSSRSVRNIGSDLLGRRDISTKLLFCNTFELFLSNSNQSNVLVCNFLYMDGNSKYIT